MRQSWSRSVKFWQRYENQQILVIQYISPSKPVRFASFLFHWMRKRNIRTLLYYNFLWMSAILMWKMENVGSSCFFFQSNRPSWLPGIESWKNVESGCCLQCIQTDPADSWAFKWTWDLYFQASLGWFCRTYEFSCQLCSLSIVLDSWYHWYLYPWSGFLYRWLCVRLEGVELVGEKTKVFLGIAKWT